MFLLQLISTVVWQYHIFEQLNRTLVWPLNFLEDLCVLTYNASGDFHVSSRIGPFLVVSSLVCPLK